MLYRIRIDLCFNAEETSQAIFDRAKQVLTKAVRIARQGEPTGESGFIEIHKCYHDEDPPKPCEVIKRIEV